MDLRCGGTVPGTHRPEVFGVPGGQPRPRASAAGSAVSATTASAAGVAARAAASAPSWAQDQQREDGGRRGGQRDRGDQPAAAEDADGRPGYRIRVCAERPEVDAGSFTLRAPWGLDGLRGADTIIVHDYPPTPHGATFERLLTWLQANLGRDLTLADIAATPAPVPVP